MKIIINNTSMVPIYEQIMEQIKAQIISGELKENDILPYRENNGKGTEDQCTYCEESI